MTVKFSGSVMFLMQYFQNYAGLLYFTFTFNTYSGFRSNRSMDLLFKIPPCSYSRMIPEKAIIQNRCLVVHETEIDYDKGCGMRERHYCLTSL